MSNSPWNWKDSYDEAPPKPQKVSVGIPTAIAAAFCWPLLLLFAWRRPNDPRLKSILWLIGGDGKMYGDPQIVGYPDARAKIIRAAQENEARHRDGDW